MRAVADQLKELDRDEKRGLGLVDVQSALHESAKRANLTARTDVMSFVKFGLMPALGRLQPEWGAEFLDAIEKWDKRALADMTDIATEVYVMALLDIKERHPAFVQVTLH